MTFWSRLMTAVVAFREAYLATTQDPQGFSSLSGRMFRYDLLWSMFENTAYRDIHAWAKRYRTEYGLYRYVRNVFNPTQRLVEFYVSHLMGGRLDPLAGDGTQRPSSLPIITDSADLRRAISTLWKASNLAITKDLVSLYGSSLGDAMIKVIDDTQRKRVYLEVLHPAVVQDLNLDAFGNVKGYRLSYQREYDGRLVTYGETAERDGDNVLYTTYRDSSIATWDEGPAQWSEPYGFVPFVRIQHRDVGLGWGWAEIYPALSKVRELDDLASKLSDQVRKTVDAPWLLAGVPQPTKRDPLSSPGREATTDTPMPGRDELPLIYSPAGSTANALVAPLDIPGTTAYIQAIMDELERDYPELRADVLVGTSEASGKALRIARQRASAKVMERRTAYDDALVRAHQMAIAIGGMRKYSGYEGYDLDSYPQGLLDHMIGDRPVFTVDETDRLEEETMLWTAAKTAKDGGVPLRFFLRRNGVSEADITALNRDPEMEARKKALETTMTGLSLTEITGAQPVATVSQDDQPDQGLGDDSTA